MSKGGNEVLAGFVVFVVWAVALVHAWDKYLHDRASARESVLRHEHFDGAAAGVGIVQREAVSCECAWLHNDGLD